MGGLSINGRTGGFNFSYDGVTNKDTGSNSGNYAAPALDSIAEVRVQTSNFQAEYGRSSGATVTVITRSGSKDFHGSAAYYKRDDTWNGNEFSRRRQLRTGCHGPVQTAATTISTTPPGRSAGRCCFRAPVVQPRPQQAVLLLVAGHARRAPTRAACRSAGCRPQLERHGDFSQSFDSQGRLLFIRDPQLDGQLQRHRPVARRASPATSFRRTASTRRRSACSTCSRCRTRRRPRPTRTTTPSRPCRTGRATTRCCASTTTSRRTRRCTAALQFGYEKRAGPVSFLGSGGGWPQQPSKYEIDTVSYVNTLLHTFNPTLFSRGDGRRELGAPVHQRVRRRGARRQRPADRAAGVPAVLPAGEP